MFQKIANIRKQAINNKLISKSLKTNKTSQITFKTIKYITENLKLRLFSFSMLPSKQFEKK